MLHPLGFGVGVVVEAQQVQQSVHHEVLEMSRRRDAALGCLQQDGLGGQHDIAEIGPSSCGMPPGGA